LNQQLARACFEQGCTKTYLIIKALAGEGFEVDPVYLSPDRRKPKG
jgi:phosphohistidine phosphatase SixA